MSRPPSPPARPAPGDPRDALFAAEREAARDVAAYVAEVAGELQSMAQEARLPLLAQFLAMAKLEAEAQAGEREGDEGSA